MKPKAYWEIVYAYFPKIVDKKLIWLSNYYRKINFKYDPITSIEIWGALYAPYIEKETINPTEYILYGTKNEN